MLTTALSLLLLGASADQPPIHDAQTLIEAIEALQEPIENFRCKYEGDMRRLDKVNAGEGRDGGKPYSSFDGRFIWTKGGDFRIDAYHRSDRDWTKLENMTVVVRLKSGQGERYIRTTDSPFGQAMIENAWKVVYSQHATMDNPRSVFRVDDLRHVLENEFHESQASDDQIDGRPVKLLESRGKGNEILLTRYWIDLARSGQRVREYV
jgi:hypothetical protein